MISIYDGRKQSKQMTQEVWVFRRRQKDFKMVQNRLIGLELVTNHTDVVTSTQSLSMLYSPSKTIYSKKTETKW